MRDAILGVALNRPDSEKYDAESTEVTRYNLLFSTLCDLVRVVAAEGANLHNDLDRPIHPSEVVEHEIATLLSDVMENVAPDYYCIARC